MAPTTVAKVVGLYLYPVKACQPISLQKTKLDSAGFQLDRAFCIVDINGDRYAEKQALSQRLLPSLASIKVEFEDVKKKNVLVLSAPNMGKKLRVYTSEKKYEKNPQVLVECAGRSTTSNGGWSLGVLPGWYCGDEATRWLSGYLNDTEKSTGKRSKPLATYVLVRACSRDAARRVSTYAGPNQMPFNSNVDLQKEGKASPFRMRDVPVSANDRVFYSDFAPLNIASLNSLNLLRDEMKYEMSDDDVNHSSMKEATTNLPSKHPITCFRPNIVVLIGDKNTPKNALTNAFGEETWKYFQIGENAKFRYLKRCPRCTVPSHHHRRLAVQEEQAIAQKTLKKCFQPKLLIKNGRNNGKGYFWGAHRLDSEGEDSVIEVGDHVQCYTHNLP